MHDGNDQKDNLRMGSRMRWKSGRLTEGTIQGRKKKINRQVSTFKIEQKNKNNNTYELEAL